MLEKPNLLEKISGFADINSKCEWIHLLSIAYSNSLIIYTVVIRYCKILQGTHEQIIFLFYIFFSIISLTMLILVMFIFCLF